MSMLFQKPLEIEIKFDGEEARTLIDTRIAGAATRQLVPLYGADESVRGTVTVRPLDGRRIEHTGIKLQLIGAIELKNDKSSPNEFATWAKELAAPGELRYTETYPFEFKSVDKPYASYNGVNARLRYYVKVTVFRRLNDTVRERDLWVNSYGPALQVANKPVKVDVGIEDCLHILFEYSSNLYHLKDVIIGRIHFSVVRVKLRMMQLSLLRKETVGTPPHHTSETETLVKFEIMDGAPATRESVPIRLFLGGYDLTPTMRDVNKKFSSRNYLQLLVMDDHGRRYYKLTEIIIYRKPEDEPGAAGALEGSAKALAGSAASPVAGPASPRPAGAQGAQGAEGAEGSTSPRSAAASPAAAAPAAAPAAAAQPTAAPSA